jgi:xylan 1,4-beta-xylosidase
MLTSSRASPRPPHQAIVNPLAWSECPDPSVVRAGRDLLIATTEPAWWNYQRGNAAYPLRRAVDGDFAQTVVIGHVFPKGHAPSWLCGAPWAPELHHDAEMGYAASFTGRDEAGRLCIGLAFAERAEGPYREYRPGPFLENPEIGVIDAHIFFDATTGRRWFYWKEDWNDRPELHRRTSIFAQELVMGAGGPELVGERTLVLENDLPIEGELVEGSSVVARDGRYYIFYSAGPYTTGAYMTSAAVGESPIGPFRKLGRNLMPNDERWEGRGHGYVAQDGHGNDYFVCHGYPAGDYRERVLLVFPIHWEDGWPRIDTRTPAVRAA